MSDNFLKIFELVRGLVSSLMRWAPCAIPFSQILRGVRTHIYVS